VLVDSARGKGLEGKIRIFRKVGVGFRYLLIRQVGAETLFVCPWAVESRGIPGAF
jgi:hypothetical protein